MHQKRRSFTVSSLAGPGQETGCLMHERQVEPPRDSFMEAAQKEMIAFELREREFSKSLKKDRAEELAIPALKS